MGNLFTVGADDRDGDRLAGIIIGKRANFA
jgi:hypothetical protein